MKSKNLCVAAGLCAGLATVAVAQEKPDLVAIDNGINVSPERIAKITMQDGVVRFQSEWQDYQGSNTRLLQDVVFDCAQMEDDGSGTRFPVGGIDCGLSGESSRWFFGSAYCNMFTTNDMTVDDSTDIAAGFDTVDFAWYWTCAGFGTETCVVAVFTQESVPCDADSFDYSGWLLDYGTLSCNPGGYYFSNVSITDGAWTAPSTGTGSYFIIFAQEVTSGGAYVLATCAQPMLWGTSDDRPGSQVTEQMDDDLDFNLSHDTVSECYTYSFGLCPDPLGAMAQFWGFGGDECGYADFDGNGTVDTVDFVAFLNAWNASDASADCTGEGNIDTQDFICFLNTWSACR